MAMVMMAMAAMGMMMMVATEKTGDDSDGKMEAVGYLHEVNGEYLHESQSGDDGLFF